MRAAYPSNAPLTAQADAIDAIEGGAGVDLNLVDNDTSNAPGRLILQEIDGVSFQQVFDFETGFGRYEGDASGNVRFTPFAELPLGDGVQGVETIAYRVVDSAGTDFISTLTVTVTGINTPTEDIDGDFSHTFSEDAVEEYRTYRGTVEVLDLDTGEDTRLAPVDPAQFVTPYGTWWVGQDAPTSPSDATGLEWGFTLAADSRAVQDLDAGEQVTLRLPIRSFDQSVGASFRIIIEGADDSFAISGDLVGDLLTGDADAATTGTLTIEGTPVLDGARFAPVSEAALEATYGRFSFDADTGVWGYTLDPDRAATRDLRSGDVVVDPFTVENLTGDAQARIDVFVTGSVPVPPPPVFVVPEMAQPALYLAWFDGASAILPDRSRAYHIQDFNAGSFIQLLSPDGSTMAPIPLPGLPLLGATLATLPDGRVLIAGSEPNLDRIFLQTVDIPNRLPGDRVDVSGDLVGELTDVDPVLTATGDILVLWATFERLPSPNFGRVDNVFSLRRLDPDLNPVSDVIDVADTFGVTRHIGDLAYTSPHAGDAAGGASFIWVEEDRAEQNELIVFGELTRDGAVATAATELLRSDVSLSHLTIAPTSDGGSLIAWQETDEDGTETFHAAQLLGTTLQTPIRVAEGTLAQLELVRLDNGFFAVVFGEERPELNAIDLRAQMFDPTGAAVGDVQTLMTQPDGSTRLELDPVPGGLEVTLRAFSADTPDGSNLLRQTVTLFPETAGLDAQPDRLSLAAGETVSGNVRDNDASAAEARVTTVSIDFFDGVSAGESIAGRFGTLIMAADGSFAYTADNAGAAAPGAPVLDRFFPQLASGDASDRAPLIFEISGIDDPTVFQGDFTASIREDAPELVVSGAFETLDPDSPDIFKLIPSDLGGRTGAFGTLRLDANPELGRYEWTYTPDHGSPLVQALDDGETLIEEFGFTTRDGTIQTLIITIEGQTDVQDTAGLALMATPALVEATLDEISTVLDMYSLPDGTTAVLYEDFEDNDDGLQGPFARHLMLTILEPDGALRGAPTLLNTSADDLDGGGSTSHRYHGFLDATEDGLSITALVPEGMSVTTLDLSNPGLQITLDTTPDLDRFLDHAPRNGVIDGRLIAGPSEGAGRVLARITDPQDFPVIGPALEPERGFTPDFRNVGFLADGGLLVAHFQPVAAPSPLAFAPTVRLFGYAPDGTPLGLIHNLTHPTGQNAFEIRMLTRPDGTVIAATSVQDEDTDITYVYLHPLTETGDALHRSLRVLELPRDALDLRVLDFELVGFDDNSFALLWSSLDETETWVLNAQRFTSSFVPAGPQVVVTLDVDGPNGQIPGFFVQEDAVAEPLVAWRSATTDDLLMQRLDIRTLTDATDDAAVALEGGPEVTGNLLANDTGDAPLRVQSVNESPVEGQVTVDGQFGQLQLFADGRFAYTAVRGDLLGPGDTGTDTFVYAISGPDGADSATLSVTVTGVAAPVLRTGTSAPDLIVGDAANEQITGLAGDDVLDGGGGSDALEGGDGDDLLYGDGLKVGLVPDIADQVYRLYQATLARTPDIGGHLGWSQALFEGRSSPAEVAAGFVGSTEFQNVYGALDNAVFVELLYQNVLGRASDPAGRQNWLDAMVNGATRADVVLGFSDSPEFQNATRGEAAAWVQAHTDSIWADDVFRLYRATFDRDPDLAGFEDWVGRLGSGTPYLSAVEGFTGSREFQRTYGPLDDVGFVSLLYQNVLDREADPAGLADWTRRLGTDITQDPPITVEAELSRAEVMAGFAQSREFVNATAAPLEAWMRAQGTDDVLDGGPGANVLMGGLMSDTFVFAQADGGTHTVMDLEAWDSLRFDGFGYTDASEALGRMTQVGADVVFADQGVAVTFVNAQLGLIDDGMIL